MWQLNSVMDFEGLEIIIKFLGCTRGRDYPFPGAICVHNNFTPILALRATNHRFLSWMNTGGLPPFHRREAARDFAGFSELFGDTFAFERDLDPRRLKTHLKTCCMAWAAVCMRAASYPRTLTRPWRVFGEDFVRTLRHLGNLRGGTNSVALGCIRRLAFLAHQFQEEIAYGGVDGKFILYGNSFYAPYIKCSGEVCTAGGHTSGDIVALQGALSDLATELWALGKYLNYVEPLWTLNSVKKEIKEYYLQRDFDQLLTEWLDDQTFHYLYESWRFGSGLGPINLKSCPAGLEYYLVKAGLHKKEERPKKKTRTGPGPAFVGWPPGETVCGAAAPQCVTLSSPIRFVAEELRPEEEYGNAHSFVPEQILSD